MLEFLLAMMSESQRTPLMYAVGETTECRMFVIDLPGIQGELEFDPPTGSPLNTFAAERMTQWARNTMTIFERDARKYRASEDPEAESYHFSGGIKVQTQTPHLVSATLGYYSFLGGAHGNSKTSTRNYGLVNGRPAMLSLASFAIRGTSPIRQKLWQKLRADRGASWVQHGVVKSLRPEQVENFWVSKNGFTWEFNPCEMRSYAEGPMSVTLTFKELKGLIRTDGPLLGLVR